MKYDHPGGEDRDSENNQESDKFFKMGGEDDHLIKLFHLNQVFYGIIH